MAEVVDAKQWNANEEVHRFLKNDDQKKEGVAFLMNCKCKTSISSTPVKCKAVIVIVTSKQY